MKEEDQNQLDLEIDANLEEFLEELEKELEATGGSPGLRITFKKLFYLHHVSPPLEMHFST